MKLRSINIKGFKSFANDTTVHFNDEIIGIVGPNGSGKSNIVDSIRWVLGEQKSKELRTEKMVDVIFNGTKSKKKASMASVSMTFENSKKLIPLEYENVKVSRILYSTNESEYRINDVTCRLKDIRNLFLDTGIGSNSYSIIELGMVDNILTDKDQARRRMFEQAAGIAKYKTRKRETLLKLKNTQQDLDRLEDILFELQSNLKKFEKQAKRTKRYYELKDQYKDLSIQKTILTQKEGIEQEQNLNKALIALQEKFSIKSNELHTLEAEIEETKKSNLDSEQLLSSKQKEFADLIDTIRRSESKIEILKQNLEFTSQNLNRVSKNKTSFNESLGMIREELTAKQTILAKLNNQTEAIKNDFEAWQGKYNEIESRRLEIQGESTSDLDELKVLEENRFQLEKTIIEINSQNTNQEQNKLAALTEKEAIDSKIKSLESTYNESKQALEKIDQEINALMKSQGNLTQQKHNLEDKVGLLKEDIAILNRKKDAQENEYQLLTDMMNNMEGFPDSSKFLMKNWNTPKPILSDIIQCTDEYRGAIEAYLEPYLNYFILDDITEARHSIDLLRQAQKGKAKFFILSSFNNTPNTQILYDHLGQPALDVITTDTKFQRLIGHLLSNVVIVDDNKILAEEFPNEDVVYIARNGNSNRTKHIVSGGSTGLFDGKRIGRQQEINRLKTAATKSTESLKAKKEELENVFQQINELTIDSIKSDLELKVNEKNQLAIHSAQVLTQLNSTRTAHQQISSRLLEYDNQASSNSGKLMSFREELQLLIGSITTKKNIVETQSGAIEEIAKSFGEVSSYFNNAQLKWVQHKSELSTLGSEVGLKENQTKELQKKIIDSDEEARTLQDKISQKERELEVIKDELIKLFEVRDQQKEELNLTEQAFFSKRNVVTDKETRLKKVNKEFQENQLEINNLKDKLTGIGFELRSGLERLKIEFNIDVKTLDKDEILASIEDNTILNEKYEKIRKRLDNYGEINPMAVEAYDEISERFVSMEEQKNDIIEAKSSLLETIKEIDQEAKGKFLDAFEKAKVNFQQVFRSLFSDEDDCDLVLFEPDDPLNSGIEIIAKPKGKRPKVLNQLSGGEKTLTATALLFSLYLLKPAPFCIFDEVDAPLDDLNIQKFTKLIRSFADESQFIIITHNKSTMANMDLLYGVYMQEQGVSGITQVDFREYEHSEVFQKVNLN